MARATTALAEFGDVPTAAELNRRRPGEEERTVVMVRLRREREHANAVAARQRRVDAAERAVQAIDVELARVIEAIDREVTVASVRARRIHEHAHCRLATYRRVLVRSHGDGDWVNSAMDTLAPDLPSWAVRGFGEDEPAEPDAQPSPDPGHWPPPVKPEVIALGPVTSIGADATGPPDSAVHVEISGYGIAAHHATLRKRGDGYRLQDHGRGNGTYQNGQAVRWIDLEVDDRFQIGDYEFRLLAGDRLERHWLGHCALVVYCLNATKPRSRSGC